ncbi:MAG: hypothetical protein LBC61_07725 [Candidatus Peribacteria bacterium]|nr:hypothetical protein [Candidatus Peribacteria bacterium]
MYNSSEYIFYIQNNIIKVSNNGINYALYSPIINTYSQLKNIVNFSSSNFVSIYLDLKNNSFYLSLDDKTYYYTM